MSSEIYAALGLKSNPFLPGACKEGYYHTEATKRILDELVYGIDARKGFLLLVGEVGLGKTSLMLQLLPKLEGEKVHTAWIFNTALNKIELLQAITQDFGLKAPQNPNVTDLIDLLHKHFLAVNGQGKNCAIIIDEAHNLDQPALEALRMLSNLELDGNKLVQILLVGQPELMEKLWKPELRQFRSRINIHLELLPLTKEETGSYVNYKLSTAGSELRVYGKALAMLYAGARGNLRLVNLVMEKTLYALVAFGKNRISSFLVAEALKDIAACHIDVGQHLKQARTKRLVARSAMGAGLAACAAAALLFVFPQYAPSLPGLGGSAGSGGVEASQQPQATASLAPTHIEPEAAPQPEPEAQAAPQPPVAKTSPAPREPDHLAAKSPEPDRAGPSTTENSAAQAAAPASRPQPESGLNREVSKVLAPMNLAGYAEQFERAVRSGAVYPLRQELPQSVEVLLTDTLPPGQGVIYQSFAWREHTGAGPAWLVLWQKPLRVNKYYPDYVGPEIAILQDMLAKLGYYRRKIDGIVGTGTWRALHAFQRDHNLARTGEPDPETLLWLHAVYDTAARRG